MSSRSHLVSLLQNLETNSLDKDLIDMNFFDDNGLFAASEKVTIRELRVGDSEDYYNLQKDLELVGDILERSKRVNGLLSTPPLSNANNLHLAIEDNQSGKMIGYMMLKNLDSETPEIGIDLLSGYRNRGLGYECVGLLIKHAVKIAGYKSFLVKIYSDNHASLALFQKFNISKMGEEDSIYDLILEVADAIEDHEDGENYYSSNHQKKILKFILTM